MVVVHVEKSELVIVHPTRRIVHLLLLDRFPALFDGRVVVRVVEAVDRLHGWGFCAVGNVDLVGVDTAPRIDLSGRGHDILRATRVAAWGLRDVVESLGAVAVGAAAVTARPGQLKVVIRVGVGIGRWGAFTEQMMTLGLGFRSWGNNVASRCHDLGEGGFGIALGTFVAEFLVNGGLKDIERDLGRVVEITFGFRS